MSEVVWAQDDLDSAIAYIANENLVAARRVLDRLEAAAEGRVAGTYEKSVRGLPYIIAYAVQRRPNRRERIVILRVIHGARNWPAGRWPR